MKHLIFIIKCFFLMCCLISVATTYQVFAKGIEWLPFAAMAIFMSYQLHKEYKEMEDDMEEHFITAVTAIVDYCEELEESGDYVVEYSHNNLFGIIELHYTIEWEEERGAEFMGDYERLVRITNKEISIKKFTCLNEMDNEYDCGFTAKDIQNAL